MERLNRVAAISYVILLAIGLYLMLTRNGKLLFSIFGFAIISMVWGPMLWATYRQLKNHFKVSDQFHRGRKGEGVIYYALKKLDDNFVVFCDVVINKTQIDYVVVCKSGIYAIEVKSHRGEITYANNELFINKSRLRQDFLRQAKTEAAKLKDYIFAQLGIEHWVQPVIVFSNKKTTLKFGLKRVDGVVNVIKVPYLKDLLDSQIINVTPESRRRIAKELMKTVVLAPGEKRGVFDGSVPENLFREPNT